jgi:hypothetical protein
MPKRTPIIDFGDRPGTHSLTNPRAVERYLDAMTLQHALTLADK